ncbi:hypothetical protein SeMB42_g06694 [Synchytrium endobioticum]|uniref:Uncharacterized protein n=1 Tax=Synchytrium endobioticum TaxID=286115 RepID=A0A507DEY6_9FUNG|nr:hypothetical protein SeMB42_g06694 [Synchytrium endobioticum]TPX50124.1 hypothetical protein SeLEV6574_g01081 [Synchytrium endobioticum]
MASAFYTVDAIDLKQPAGKPHYLESRIHARRRRSSPTFLPIHNHSTSLDRHTQFLEDRKSKLRKHHSHLNRVRSRQHAKYMEELDTKRAALEARLRLSAQRRQKLLTTPRSKWICTESSHTTDDTLLIRLEAAKAIQAAWRHFKQASAVKGFVKHGLSLQQATALSFEKLAKIAQYENLIKATTKLLARLRKSAPGNTPHLSTAKNMARVFLSAYMIAAHPDKVMAAMGPQEMGLKDLADRLLSKFESWIAGFGLEGAQSRLLAFLPAWEEYHVAFEAWKNKDTDKIIDTMITHWIELEKLWLNVKGNAGAEVQWRPRVEQQQRQILERLARFGRAALQKLSDTVERVRAENGLLDDNNAGTPVADGAEGESTPSDMMSLKEEASEPVMLTTDTEPDMITDSSRISSASNSPSRPGSTTANPLPLVPTSPERFPGLATLPRTDSVKNSSKSSNSRAASPASSPPPTMKFERKPTPSRPSPLHQTTSNSDGSPVSRSSIAAAFGNKSTAGNSLGLQGTSSNDHQRPSVDLNAVSGAVEGGLTNEALAHELLMDPEFELKPAKRSPFEEQVRAMAKRAFFDAVRDNPEQHLPTLLSDIRQILLSMVSEKGAIAAEIREMLDAELIHKQISNKIFQVDGYVKYIIGKMAQLCAPIRDASIKAIAAQVETDLAGAFEQILNILEEMKLDLANYKLQLLKPHLTQQAVEYERSKFDEALSKGSITLEKTRAWLESSAKSLQEVLNSRDPEGVFHPEHRVRYEDAYHEALLSLIFNNTTPITRDGLPETMVLDADRLKGFQNEAQAITIVASLLMLSRNATGELRNDTAALTKLKETLFVLLRDDTTTVDHLSALIVSTIQSALTISGKTLPEAQVTLIKTMVDKTLSHTDAVFTLLSRRASAAIKNQLATSQFRRDTLASGGLDLVGKELEDLSRKMYLMTKHNKEVHARHYDDILKKVLMSMLEQPSV